MSGEFGVEEIFTKYLGKTEKKDEHVISYFEKFLMKQSKLIGKDIKLSTWKKSEYVYQDVTAFIEAKFGKKDFPLNKLDQAFLDDFEYYLKTVKNQKQITINKAIQRLRKPIKDGRRRGISSKGSICLTQARKGHKSQVIFLSNRGAGRCLEEHMSFKQPRLDLSERPIYLLLLYGAGVPRNGKSKKGAYCKRL